MSRSVVIALDTRLARIVNLQEPINAGASIIVPRGGSKVIISHQPRRDNRRPLTIRDISDKRATRVKEKKKKSVYLCVCVISSRSFSGEKYVSQKMWDENVRNKSHGQRVKG